MTHLKVSRTETSGMVLRPNMSNDPSVFLPFYIFIYGILSASIFVVNC